MSDLISRSALLQEFETENNRQRDSLWHYTGIKAFIELQPPVEAVPVVHGEWIKTRLAGEYECSNCHCIEYESLTKSGFKLFDFCPNCGADMRKKV